MTPEDQLRMMDDSMRCQRRGLAGLVPGLGIGHAIIAVFLFFRVRMFAAQTWNPASLQLYRGLIFGMSGLFVSLLLLALVLKALLE